MARRSKSGQGAGAEQASGWGVYMLRCGDGSLYTGCTNRLDVRVKRHRAGAGAAYTRSRLPVRLVFWEVAADRSAALRREHALKQLPRPEKLALVKASAAPRRKKRARPTRLR